jgi:predicted aminopeptidase
MVTDLLSRILTGALLLTVTAALSGCGTLYIAQAAQGQVQLLAARRPIERVIADPRTAAPVRAKLEAMREIRRFAVEALALPDNASYRSYADIGRPYVVWNVVATPEFSVEPLHWCFPVAGCVAYRGYFKEARATAFALGLESRGDDAFVGGVPAYSTLGRFADPILSTMIDYPDSDLAAVVFHELAHQRVYAAGDSQFNEAFAETVEETGLARWLAARGRSDELARFERRRASQQAFVGIFVRGRERLRVLYAQPLPAAQMRLRKAEMLADIAAQVRARERARGVRSGFDDWLESGLNNAHLASVGTYFDCVPAFERLLAAGADDLPSFYAAVARLARGPPAGRHAFCAHPAA